MESRLKAAETSGTQSERNTAIRNSTLRPTTIAMKIGQPAGDLVGEILQRGRGAADVDVDPRAASRGREHVVAQPVDELGGALVLGRALRDHV